MAEFDIAKISGLSQEEAEAKLARDGYNELPSAVKRNAFAIAYDVIKEPMFLLLVACGSVYLLLGSPQEALALLGFVFVVMGITFYQERKTERALEALRNLSSPRALVIRDGEQKRIAGRDVVVGDIIVLAEGDRVPADANLLSSSNLHVDESMLTGESIPVNKIDDKRVYSGSLVVQGYAVAKVTATGTDTEMGKIGQALKIITPESTLIQKETKKLVGNLAVIGLLVALLVIVLYGLTRGDWLQATLAGITLAMATLPEEFPVVLTVFLALGAWRISKSEVLTRRVPAVETLGSASVLCVDKTGTLTHNKLCVSELFANTQLYDAENPTNGLPENFHQLIEFGILASQKEPFDPLEKAIKDLGTKTLTGTEHLHKSWSLVREYPLSKKLMAISHVWRSPVGDNYVIASKGAPEAIADLCHFTKEQNEKLAKDIEEMAERGLRVLGVAKAYFKLGKEIPEVEHEYEFEFVGLIGLKDQIRESVPLAIKECYAGGIRLIMITGDYPSTARNIAQNIGLTLTGNIITGSQLNQMSEVELRKKINSVNVFARVVPEQKLRIVEALKANGEVVAMTGDGVNDAPALKSADIGIAMGQRGTDVARETADLVLLDDDFSSIVKAVKIGRRIFENLKKAVSYIFAVHVPIVGMTLIPVLFRWPLILAPIHIAFLELIIDPTSSIVFESEPAEPDIMDRPPRHLSEPLFSSRTVGFSLLQGAMVLVILLAVYYTSTFYYAYSLAHSRALIFIVLVISNLSLILTNRSWTKTAFSRLETPNKALWWVLAATISLLFLVLFVPFLKSLFLFSSVGFADLLVGFIAGGLSIFWFELIKFKKTLKF
ncbi:MAG: cation-translocating P-type ATPase [Actinobacteria bacterium]|nr:MAG: cation-translocating P-type ATPase [Actinomycetota bacterium]